MHVVKSPASAAEMVLTLELNLEREKTGDVDKFHNTYVIHIFKFMITYDTYAIKFPIREHRQPVV